MASTNLLEFRDLVIASTYEVERFGRWITRAAGVCGVGSSCAVSADLSGGSRSVALVRRGSSFDELSQALSEAILA